MFAVSKHYISGVIVQIWSPNHLLYNLLTTRPKPAKVSTGNPWPENCQIFNRLDKRLFQQYFYLRSIFSFILSKHVAWNNFKFSQIISYFHKVLSRIITFLQSRSFIRLRLWWTAGRSIFGSLKNLFNRLDNKFDVKYLFSRKWSIRFPLSIRVRLEMSRKCWFFKKTMEID